MLFLALMGAQTRLLMAHARRPKNESKRLFLKMFGPYWIPNRLRMPAVISLITFGQMSLPVRNSVVISMLGHPL
jgi:hypothetical protein